MRRFTLVLSGERRREQFRVYFEGKPRLLQHTSLMTLVDLLCARLHSAAGYGNAKRAVIHRLRRELGDQDKTLIDTGNKEEYRITIPPPTFDGMTVVGIVDIFANIPFDRLQAGAALSISPYLRDGSVNEIRSAVRCGAKGWLKLLATPRAETYP